MDKEGWAPVSVVASFNRIAQATQDFSVIVEAVKDSEVVETKDGIWVRRKNVDSGISTYV